MEEERTSGKPTTNEMRSDKSYADTLKSKITSEEETHKTANTVELMFIKQSEKIDTILQQMSNPARSHNHTDFQTK